MIQIRTHPQKHTQL